jgi:lipopolysaccharide/colanic/teichoic acid biosynthesis glycosyltransferase
LTQPESRQVIARTVPRSAQVSSYSPVKRLLDLLVGSLALVILSPVLIIVGVAIALDSGLPILYRCQRLGRHGRRINVLKFRTMANGSHNRLDELLSADEERRREFSANRKLRDDPRRTRVGAILRRTSLDELPQLFNVIRGDMSLVGPRPYFADELLGRPEAQELLSVRPGITGLWQVNGRSDRSFEERLALELDYVQRRSLRLDLSIALRTIGAVVSGRGAY